MRDAARILLAWYDGNARDLPWRVGPAARAAGVRPDPYHVWLSEIMLQQTTVAAVKPYFERFLSRWPTVQALAAAPDEDVMAAWAGLGYYARARNLLKCARVVSDALNGAFPETALLLQTLPGIGPYTGAAIAAIAFDEPATVVDGNVERVVARLFTIKTPLPAAKPEMRAAAARLTPPTRPGDFAQAMMDLGATVCTPKSPACGICPLNTLCTARAKGIAAVLPARSPKPVKPVRLGVVFLARRGDGAFLLERRPDKGLLGGMLGWPGSPWVAVGSTPDDKATPPVPGPWQDLPGEVRHTFTHFHLRLSVRIAHVKDATQARGHWVAARDFDPNALPTVMRKAWDLARGSLVGET